MMLYISYCKSTIVSWFQTRILLQRGENNSKCDSTPATISLSHLRPPLLIHDGARRRMGRVQGYMCLLSPIVHLGNNCQGEQSSRHQPPCWQLHHSFLADALRRTSVFCRSWTSQYQATAFASTNKENTYMVWVLIFTHKLGKCE